MPPISTGQFTRHASNSLKLHAVKSQLRCLPVQLGLVGLPAVAAGSVEEDEDSWGGWAATGNTHKEVETAKVKGGCGAEHFPGWMGGGRKEQGQG